jgi:hypothetical protein
MKMEAVYSSETVVRIDTVSKPDRLGVYLHPALKRAMFRAGHASCEGCLLNSMTTAAGRLEWRCARAFRGLEILGSQKDANR